MCLSALPAHVPLPVATCSSFSSEPILCLSTCGARALQLLGRRALRARGRGAAPGTAGESPHHAQEARARVLEQHHRAHAVSLRLRSRAPPTRAYPVVKPGMVSRMASVAPKHGGAMFLAGVATLAPQTLCDILLLSRLVAPASSPIGAGAGASCNKWCLVTAGGSRSR